MQGLGAWTRGSEGKEKSAVFITSNSFCSRGARGNSRGEREEKKECPRDRAGAGESPNRLKTLMEGKLDLLEKPMQEIKVAALAGWAEKGEGGVLDFVKKKRILPGEEEAERAENTITCQGCAR